MLHEPPDVYLVDCRTPETGRQAIVNVHVELDEGKHAALVTPHTIAALPDRDAPFAVSSHHFRASHERLLEKNMIHAILRFVVFGLMDIPCACIRLQSVPRRRETGDDVLRCLRGWS